MARTAEPDLVHLDTHIVCWLYEGRVELLSAPARAALERGRLAVSPIVDLELQFLYEIGRILKGPAAVLSALGRDLGLRISEMGFASVVAAAREFTWTRDPFDRLIVGEAAISGALLVSKDRLIRRHFPASVW